ncbi:MAG: glycyl tRNA synthetase [Candidatus Saccharibacteria bacterium]|nr:glycyl tRNA synthetase [Candidatus Saccharibacteria bacterium]
MAEISLEEIVSLAKRRGFIYQGSEIYGGLAGTWDYGPLGIQLKRTIENLWWKHFVEDRDDMYGVDTAILMNPKVWEASGHIQSFTDPLVEDIKTKKRYRLDHLLEENGVDIRNLNLGQMIHKLKELKLTSPEGNELGNAAMFNLLFKTNIGAVEGEASKVYLRGETAQGMFVNFKNILDSFYPNLPFGIAQIGRAFRNEISPRDFVFRTREFGIMELEYFIRPETWEAEFQKWIDATYAWFEALGLPKSKIHEKEVPKEERAHYSKRTLDFEFEYPFGIKEIAGLAYRTDFDLAQHELFSGKNLKYTPKEGGEPFIPHVIEPTYGLERHILAVLANAYTVDEVNGEKRIYLKLPAQLAPIKVAVFPLLKNKPELTERAREVYRGLVKEFGAVTWDDNGNIGKRYRRQDEIGTPHCVTIDFQTLEDNTVTIRDRDTTTQERINVEELTNKLRG